MDKPRLIATCDEMLAFLAANDQHRKLRRLSQDIELLRERLLHQHAPGAAPFH